MFITINPPKSFLISAASLPSVDTSRLMDASACSRKRNEFNTRLFLRENNSWVWSDNGINFLPYFKCWQLLLPVCTIKRKVHKNPKVITCIWRIRRKYTLFIFLSVFFISVYFLREKWERESVCVCVCVCVGYVSITRLRAF